MNSTADRCRRFCLCGHAGSNAQHLQQAKGVVLPSRDRRDSEGQDISEGAVAGPSPTFPRIAVKAASAPSRKPARKSSASLPSPLSEGL